MYVKIFKCWKRYKLASLGNKKQFWGNFMFSGVLWTCFISEYQKVNLCYFMEEIHVHPLMLMLCKYLILLVDTSEHQKGDLMLNLYMYPIILMYCKYLIPLVDTSVYFPQGLYFYIHLAKLIPWRFLKPAVYKYPTTVNISEIYIFSPKPCPWMWHLMCRNRVTNGSDRKPETGKTCSLKLALFKNPIGAAL